MPKSKTLSPVFIIDGLRTAIGSPFKGLKNYTAAQLAAEVIRGMLIRNKLKKNLINEVILGNTVSAGTGQNLARQAVILAGLPASIPAFTVNNVCGAGLQSVILAAQSILCGDSELVIAGGAESASHSPDILFKQKQEKTELQEPVESLVHDGLFCSLSQKHMGQLSEFIIKRYKISREEQDVYALKSHRKACRAYDHGKFKAEIIPLKSEHGHFLRQDERPRKNVDLTMLADLPPAFESEGTVTAGNSSVPCDGAAAVIVASEKLVKIRKWRPQARLLGYATVALDPKLVFSAGVSAIEACLKKCGLSVKDFDLFEISEAFASQAILTMNSLKIPQGKVNIWGGDIALGHPLGAAGTRILVTLMRALADQKKKRGLACICLGGGGAVCMAIERVK